MTHDDVEKLLDYKRKLAKNKQYLLQEFCDIARINDEKRMFTLLFKALSNLEDPCVKVLYYFFNNECIITNISKMQKQIGLSYKPFMAAIDKLTTSNLLRKEKFGRQLVIYVNPKFEKRNTKGFGRR